MLIFQSKEKLSDYCKEQKQDGKKIGFVPTMGALHKGHASLISCASQSCDVSVVSIFVNPTQFNNSEDLKSYPRNREADIAFLKELNCSAVFLPDEKEIYPEPDNRVFDLNGLDRIMEGKHRPGHFNGVAQIVSKLFEIVKPHFAYFGKKDFQQLAVIKHIAENYFTEEDIKIIGCDTIREEDGLAMSSRNSLLKEEERKEAVKISYILFDLKDFFEILTVGKMRNYVKKEIKQTKHLELEYFEVADSRNLKLLPDDAFVYPGTTACIAVLAGKTRLIDNISL